MQQRLGSERDGEQRDTCHEDCRDLGPALGLGIVEETHVGRVLSRGTASLRDAFEMGVEESAG